MEANENHLFQPLLTTTTTTNDIAFSNSGIKLRFALVFFIMAVTVFANYHASQGFEIVLTNNIKDTPNGRKFHLFLVSNDKATRMVLDRSELVEKVLYPDDWHPKKPVIRVTIALTKENFTHQVEVVHKTDHEYILQVSSSLMEERNVESAMELAVQRGMTLVWLWNGEGGAPEVIVNGVVEYINLVAAGAASLELPDYRLNQLPAVEKKNLCWKQWDYIEMAYFLRYCEMMNDGFIGRLNQAMQGRWHDLMVDDALGMPVQPLCKSYYSSISQVHIQTGGN